MALYTLYGLTIDSEFPLNAPRANGPVDLTVGFGPERPIPEAPPAGRIMSELKAGPINSYATQTDGGYVIRVPEKCDAVVNETLSTVELIVAAPERRAFAELLFAGSIMAKILALGGACLLHASAVAAERGAIAYIGPAGRGKSTLAALTCAAGGRLITDDVLRVVPRPDGWHCLTGTGQIRLRQQAGVIAPLLGGAVEETFDHRIGISVDLTDTTELLSALVFPKPSRSAASVRATRLTEHDTLMRLTAFPRTVGWKDPEVIAHNFRWSARLAREVPAFEAEVPWGPPFDPSVASELLKALRVDA